MNKQMGHYRTSSSALALGVLLACLASAALAKPVEGQLPPDLVGSDQAGKPVLLNAYHGKAVVLTFWATWCGYCKKELPVLHDIQQQAGRGQLEVIAVNTESEQIFQSAAKALAKLDLNIINDDDGKVAKAYGVDGLPHMVIIGRDGKVIAIHRGFDERILKNVAADINLALASKPAPAKAPSTH